MTYTEAQRKIRYYRLIGIALIAVGLLFTVISALKFLAFGLTDQGALASALTEIIRRLVASAHDNTQFLSFFWTYAPMPTRSPIASLPNLFALFFYILAFVGTGFWHAATSLSQKLGEVRHEIQKEALRQSVSGGKPRSVTEVQKEIEISVSTDESWLSKFHTLYIAPIIVAILGAIVLKMLNLV